MVIGHIVDRASLIGYLQLGLRLVEDNPHWLLINTDNTLYATVDAALARAYTQGKLW